MVDVIIVGAGPSGLNAALFLGRCRRRVVVFDNGRPRNAASHGLHGFLTRDGIEPAELLRIGREQLRAYPSVELRETEVVAARCLEEGFEVKLKDGSRLSARILLMATGIVDEIPRISGIEPLYGRSVHHCPYCDGWEWRDRPIAVHGRGHPGLKLALELTCWSKDLVLCTDGPSGLNPDDRDRLACHEIALREEPIDHLEGTDGFLERIHFRGGPPLDRRALFFKTGSFQRSHLAGSLGCERDGEDDVKVGEHGMTSVKGAYLVGDASKEVTFAIVAAAEGAKAAVAINNALIQKDLANAEAQRSTNRRSPSPTGRGPG